MNNRSRGVSDDMSCAYDQAKLGKGKSSKVVPNFDKQATSDMSCPHVQAKLGKGKSPRLIEF